MPSSKSISSTGTSQRAARRSARSRETFSSSLAALPVLVTRRGTSQAAASLPCPAHQSDRRRGPTLRRRSPDHSILRRAAPPTAPRPANGHPPTDRSRHRRSSPHKYTDARIDHRSEPMPRFGILSFFSAQPIRFPASGNTASAQVPISQPIGVVSPGRLAISIRYSSLSLPSFSAISSICVSIAQIICGSPCCDRNRRKPYLCARVYRQNR